MGEHDADTIAEDGDTVLADEGEAEADGDSAATADAPASPSGLLAVPSALHAIVGGDPGEGLFVVEPVELLETESDAQTMVHDGAERVSAESAPAAERYEDIGRLGQGGMGEVRRVRDQDLNRTVAMKVVRKRNAGKPAILARFVEEAQVGAQLQHPGIVPVHDIGRLPDGRIYFTMREVRGRSLRDVLDEFHAGEGPWTLRGLVDLFRRVCDAVGYAHARGVVHRDLKPANVMVGRDGEVLVVDWGVALVLARGDAAALEDDDVHSVRSLDERLATRAGSITGTPGYMSPEQALGERGTVGPASDVYALGAMLYEIIAGRRPFLGSPLKVLVAVVTEDPPSLSTLSSKPVPPGLEAIVSRAMARAPSNRFTDGRAIAAAVTDWLDGVAQRERAHELVEAAERAARDGVAASARATALRARGEAELAAVPAWAPEDDKHAAWSVLDAADASAREAEALDLSALHALQSALTYAPQLERAHLALVERAQRDHETAEAARDWRGAARAAQTMRAHLDAVPRDAPERLRCETYLTGDGLLNLVVDPPGATVEFRRYTVRHRRLIAVATPIDSLETPVFDLPLPMGSYLLLLSAPGCATIRYPVEIGRCSTWLPLRPGDTEIAPVRLPRIDELDDDEVYVAGGWFRAGGDALAAEAFPALDLWADAFAMQRYPVTNREFIAFLDDLVDQGRGDEALAFAPRERTVATGEYPQIYGRRADGHFELVPDADGDLWEPDWPVLRVTWYAARAYAAWLATRTGQPWRLPHEGEWERAARGVDGRPFVWGDYLDPSWACVGASHRGQALPAPVGSFPIDESPWGVRGLNGNVRDWCENLATWSPDDGTIVPVGQEASADVEGMRSVRGGSWGFHVTDCRVSDRFQNGPGKPLINLGIRLVRSMP